MDRKSWGLVTACIGILMCLIFWFTIRYEYWSSKLDEKMVNYEFAKVQDYTVTAKIPSELYSFFL